MDMGNLQDRVHEWVLEAFGFDAAANKTERNHRFLEESLELVQAQGCTASEAHQLVDYVFGRPEGEASKEVGAVLLTLSALCNASDIDMSDAVSNELENVGASWMPF